MKILYANKYSVHVELTHQEFSRLTGQKFADPDSYIESQNHELLKCDKSTGVEFDLKSFFYSQDNYKRALESKAKVKDYLETTIRDLDQMFWPIEPLRDEGSK